MIILLQCIEQLMTENDHGEAVIAPTHSTASQSVVVFFLDARFNQMLECILIIKSRSLYVITSHCAVEAKTQIEIDSLNDADY